MNGKQNCVLRPERKRKTSKKEKKKKEKEKEKKKKIVFSHVALFHIFKRHRSSGKEKTTGK